MDTPAPCDTPMCDTPTPTMGPRRAAGPSRAAMTQPHGCVFGILRRAVALRAKEVSTMDVPDHIEQEVFIAAPVSRVWALLTEPEHIAVWYAFGGADVDARPGGAAVFRWPDHGEFHAVVEAVEPHRRFAFRLAVNPNTRPEPGTSTLVEFTLHAEDEGTRLRLVETGFQQLTSTEAGRLNHAEAERAGWAGGLSILRKYAPAARA